MKKILSISLILATALTFNSCVKEEDDIFDKSAAERLNEASDLYSSRLMASPNGWAMQLYPTNYDEWPYGNGYLLLCRFNSDHSVNVAMNNIFSNNEYKEDTSLWEVITDNGPVLSFNSHNDCLHAFSDPYDLLFTGDADNPNNESGTGAEGDYEFIIVDAPEDASYMMLKGKKRGTYNLLTPIEVGVDYHAYFNDVQDFTKKMFSSSSPTFDVIHLGDSLLKMTEASDGIPNIFPYHGNAIYDESFNAFLITKLGNDYYLRFRDKINFGEGQYVQEFVYRPERDVFEAVNDASSYIEGDDPLRYFDEALDNNSSRWSISESSSTFEALRNNLIEQIAATSTSTTKNTFDGIRFSIIDSHPVLQIIYNFSSSRPKVQGQTVLSYKFDKSKTDGGIKFTYLGPTGIKEADVKSSEDAANFFTSIPQLINYFVQEFKVDAKETRFLLSGLKLTPTADGNAWMTLVKN